MRVSAGKENTHAHEMEGGGEKAGVKEKERQRERQEGRNVDGEEGDEQDEMGGKNPRNGAFISASQSANTIYRRSAFFAQRTVLA